MNNWHPWQLKKSKSWGPSWSTNVFEEELNATKFLEWLKTFGPAQNILGPVKGQGISTSI